MWHFFVIVLVVTAASPASADIFRYVDDSGVVCYTDAPVNRKAEKIIRTELAATQREAKNTASQLYPKADDFHSIVKDKADKYELDPSLVHAVIKAESNGNPSAVSRKGAMGLMQLMPTTATDMEVRNPFDPEENIDGGSRYLRFLLDRFGGDLTLALAAYNAGPKTVEKTGAVPRIPETKEYVKKVLSLYSGSPFAPVSSSGGGPQSSRQDPIFKVVSSDGSILFTNSPLYRKYPRF